MDNSLVKTTKSSNLEMPLQQPLSIPSVTLHLEATRYFCNRILSVSFTEENGWNVKEIESPLDVLNNSKKEKNDKTPSRIQRSGIRKSSNNSKSEIEDVNSKSVKKEKFKDMRDLKKLMKLKFLLFGTTWSDLAPKSFTAMPNGKQKRYQCIECPFNSQIAVRVAEHFYTDHNPGTNFQCPYCCKEFKLRHTLRIHLITACKRIPLADRENILNTTRKNFLDIDT